MDNRYIYYKRIGETPLQAINRLRKEEEISETIPMTYAGRLDPLVEGLLIVLVGDECKNKDMYTKFAKTYEFEILTGFSTDSYDLLGLVTGTHSGVRLVVDDIDTYLFDHKKTFTQMYPPYSSKTFDGKQLHQHAREGNNPKIKHDVTLHDFVFLGEQTVKGNELLEIIIERITLVDGDFRQKEIVEKWKDIISSQVENQFQITKWRIDVSSGFYVRQLVQDIGNHFHIPTVTFYIKRTKIGEYVRDKI